MKLLYICILATVIATAILSQQTEAVRAETTTFKFIVGKAVKQLMIKKKKETV